jgi:zinc transport system substrate-binding protein
MFGLFGIVPNATSGSSKDKPTVAVANYPLQYFAERIAGGKIEVIFPIPSDIDPAFWKPEPAGILRFQTADLILLNGAHYSKWLDKVTLPRRKLVNTSQEFKDKFITIQDFTTHRHGPQGKHAHTGLAFTTWLDFQQAVHQAEAIFKAMVILTPEHKAHYTNNFGDLKKELLALDQRVEDMVARNRDQPLVASHPIYDYFARRYGLNIRSVLWEPDDLPNRQQWLALQTLLKNHPAKWMIWEDQPLSQSVERLEALGIHSVVFHPAGNVPDQGDFLTIMRQNIERVQFVYP